MGELVVETCPGVRGSFLVAVDPPEPRHHGGRSRQNQTGLP